MSYVLSHNDTDVHLFMVSVAAQMQFCFARYDAASSTCQGNLLGTVSSAEDCCLPTPRGLGGGGYVAAGSEDCQTCLTLMGKLSSIINLQCNMYTSAAVFENQRQIHFVHRCITNCLCVLYRNTMHSGIAVEFGMYAGWGI